MSTLAQQLRRLSAAEWQQLRAQTDAFFSLTPATQQRAEREDVQQGGDYLTALLQELQRRKLLSRTLRSFPRGMLQQVQVAQVDRVWGQVQELIDRDLSAAERARLAGIAARALAALLENDPVALSPKRLVTNVTRTMVALDWVFPGYVQAGLLSFALRSRKRRSRG